MTFWPDIDLGPPVVRHTAAAQVVGDEVEWYGGASPEAWGLIETVRLPDEFVLRELLDLVRPEHRRAELAGLPRGESFDPDLWLPGPKRLAARVAAGGYLLGVEDAVRSWASTTSPPPFAIRLEARATSFRAIELINLVRHWIAWMDGSPVTQLWTNVALEQTEESAWRCFERFLNTGLASQALHGEYRPRSDGAAKALDLYDACCIQLYTLIREDPHLLTCHNESCTRRFVRQRQPNETTSPRSRDAKYCTPRCANTQNQRQTRRRRKERADD